jgi:hypothetical protein
VGLGPTIRVGGPQTNFTRDRMDIENLNGRVVLEGTMPR